ncbi:MAG: ATP-dependent helicase [Planctomycetes bacterium]|nr:ATP-dependent helicase [Planctomycetota bacterium]
MPRMASREFVFPAKCVSLQKTRAKRAGKTDGKTCFAERTHGKTARKRVDLAHLIDHEYLTGGGVAVKIARLIGAAGSGKTTELLRIMEAALPKLGGDPLRLGFASFTRAARAEAVGRAAAAWNVSPSMLDGEGWFRTVHSTAKRCLGIAPGQLIGNSTKDNEWISNALGVKVSTSIDEDTGQQKFVGGPEGAALTCWQRARNTLQPLDEVVRRMRRLDDEVPDFAAVVRIAERYEMAKRVEDRLDFCDLLLRFTGFRVSPLEGIGQGEPEGELPNVNAWIFDEQQDASPLLDAACKRLVTAESVQWVYVAGDPFQSVFGFAGSSAECFLGWPADKERIMPKSYRCPAPILALGERCLRRMHRGYFDRKVAPADHEGQIHESEVDPPVMRARPDEDWLFIARTNYEAARLYATLHAAGKPARWVKQPDGVSVRGQGLAALYALEKGQHVSGGEWARAIDLLPTNDNTKASMLDRGVKTHWGKNHADEWDVIFQNDLQQVGATETLVERIRSGKWCGLINHGEEWRRHAERWGPGLASNSRIRVGTVHSVKGMEADNVALLTTIGKRVEQGRDDCQEQHDEECRIAYVAVTRARRNLYIVNEGRHGKPVPRMEVL